MNLVLFGVSSFAFGFIATIALLRWLVIEQENVICNINGKVKFVSSKDVKVAKKVFENESQ